MTSRGLLLLLLVGAVAFASSSSSSSGAAAAFAPDAAAAFCARPKAAGTSRPSPSLRPLGATAATAASKNTLDGKDIDGEFVPANNMLLVKKAATVDTTDGGIILTGKQKITKSEGVVVSAGPGRTDLGTGYRHPMPVSKGERVLFGKYDGTEVTYNGEKCTLIRDDDVLVKFPPPGDDSGDSASGDSGSDLDSAEVVWDAVLVRVPRIEQEKSSSGILFAKTTSAKKKRSSVGEVVKVGPGRRASNGVLMEMDVRPGDRIKFRDFAAQEVEIDDEEFAVVRMTDVLAKF